MIGGRNMKTESTVKSLYKVESVLMIIPVSILGFVHVDAIKFSYKLHLIFSVWIARKGHLKARKVSLLGRCSD